MAPRGRRAAVLCAVALLVGCTSGGDDVPLERAGSEPQATQSTFRIGVERPRSIDPAASSPASWADLLLADLFYDTLTTIGADGVAAPGLATFDANADRTIWRFTVDADAAFGDGRAITADDVVFSLERVRGLGAGSLSALRLSGIETVRAVDIRTVEVILDSPSAVLPELLAAPLYPILDPSAVQRAVENIDQTPNPSSGYSATFDGAGELVLSRTGDVGPATVSIRFFDTADAALDAHLAGELDLAPIPPGRVGEATRKSGASGIVPFQGTLYLGLNMRLSPLDDVRLRRAIASAIDRALLVDGVYGASASPLSGYLPIGVAGSAADACLGRCSLAIGTAQSLMEQVFPGGVGVPSLTIATDGSSSQRAAAGVIATQLEGIGLDVDTLDFPAGTFEQLVATGQHQLFLFGWLGHGRTPQTYLTPLLSSRSPDQIFGIADDAVDAALATAATDPVPSTRQLAWQQAEKLGLDLVPAVPLVQFQTLTVRSERVERLDHRVDGTVDLATLVLAGD